MPNKPGLVIALICFVFSPLSSAQNGRSQYPPPGRLVDVGGYRVHINCTGTGSPTVMIVGAGFSVDWGLVQPEVAKFSQVCTYDPSGSAWSDAGPAPTTSGRIAEIHALLKNAGIKGPVVLVGHSIGAVFARLYANRYPNDVAGMVIVDHAAVIRMVVVPPGTSTTPPPGLHLPQGPIAGFATFEDDPAFQNLPALNREMHHWATSLPSNQNPRSQRQFFDQALDEVETTTQSRSDPLGNMPLVVISTALDAPDYLELQGKLLALSHNSKQLIAEKSGHSVTIDQPEVIISGIHQVVDAVRKGSSLKN